MKKSTKKGRIVIPAGRKPWPHELRVAEILAAAGHMVEFLPETSLKTADIRLYGVEYEIKSPFTNKPDKLERNLKRALKQSKNIIFDSSRTKNIRDDKLYKFLMTKAGQQKQIGRLIFITKRGRTIEISGQFC